MSSLKRRYPENTETECRVEQLVLENTEGTEVGDNAVPKMLEVINHELIKELRRREMNLEEIEDRVKNGLRTQHYLRYAIVSSYYGARTSQGEWPDFSSGKQLVHPAIAGLSRKQKPKRSAEDRIAESGACDSDGHVDEKETMEDELNLPTKIPRYIPPTMKNVARETTSPTRGCHTQSKYCIIVGNVSRWIPVENRDDGASHKWMVYARCPPKAPAISEFVSKVRFFLHPSYRPFDVVEVASPPFRLSRRGWGEFSIRVQVHFHNPMNKPVTIFHRLVLDRMKTGRQAFGAETVVKGWYVDDDPQQNECAENVIIKEETWEDDSQGPMIDCSPATTIHSGPVEVNRPSSPIIYSKERARSYNKSWVAPENLPNMSYECTSMRREDMEELGEEEKHSSNYDLASESNFSSEEKILVDEFETTTGVPNFEEGEAMADQVSIKEEPMEEECDVKEEYVPVNPVVKEELVFCDVNEDFLTVQEEVVIEDGCFPRSSEEDSIVDMPSSDADSGVSFDQKPIIISYSGEHSQPCQSTGLKVQNTVDTFGGIFQHLQKSESISVRIPSSAVPVETPSVLHVVPEPHKPAGPLNTKQGPPVGVSLLMKGSSIRPGTSLLIQNSRPTQPSNHSIIKSNQLSSQSTISPMLKPAVDPKAAVFARNYSKLQNCIHNDPEAATNSLLKALPIITPNASNPAYKTLHHYAAASLDEFFSWPIAKQRATERARAVEVRKLLTLQGFSAEKENALTVKDIMIWARLRGYAPQVQKVNFAPLHSSSTEGHSDVASNVNTTFSEPKVVNEWLSSVENEKPCPLDEDGGEEIDVMNEEGAPKTIGQNSSGHRRVGLGARAAVGHKVILLGMEPSLGDIPSLVDEISRKIGAVLSCPEEIIPCVFYPAAHRVLVEAVKSFIDDLVRGSYSSSLRRTSDSFDPPLTITVEDVRNAVLNKQEFDILTNEGLSTEPDDSMKWDGPI